MTRTVTTIAFAIAFFSGSAAAFAQTGGYYQYQRDLIAKTKAPVVQTVATSDPVLTRKGERGHIYR